jgi:DNA-binding response OmpR family regulator
MAVILLIDDERGMRQIIVKTLERAGHSVLQAENGETGLALFMSHKPQLVITDVFMPDKDGIETIREIKAQAPGTRILAVSGGGRAGRTEFLDVAKSFGADMALQKPFRIQSLLETVEQLLGKGQ